MAAPSTEFSKSQTASNILGQLPKAKWMGDRDIYYWEGFWYVADHVQGTLAVQSNFLARHNDIILVTPPKAGTTWLKALLTAIKYPATSSEEPLTKNNPHHLVKTLECDLYLKTTTPDLSGIPSPRIFHTHLPYNALPDSIKNSRCKIVYLARNTKDTFVSLYHFMNTLRTTHNPEQGPYPIDSLLDEFCRGIHAFGPYLDHVLGYWKHSLENGEKLLFMKYEELKTEPKKEVKKLGEFLDKPFCSDEEVEEVLWRCSFERLKNLEVNVSGTHNTVKHSSFFSLGVVGDWKNCLTEVMVNDSINLLVLN